MGLSRDLTARQLAGHSDNPGTAEVVDRVACASCRMAG